MSKLFIPIFCKGCYRLINALQIALLLTILTNLPTERNLVANIPTLLRTTTSYFAPSLASSSTFSFTPGTASAAPRWQTTPLTGIISLDTSEWHTCAVVDPDGNGIGGVKCWGTNDYGQLGDGSTTDRSLPVDVSGLTNGAVAVGVGKHHSCAILSSGRVKCWGNNSTGQLGDRNSSGSQSRTPVDVVGLNGDNVTALSGGGFHTCALTSGGGVKCWGYNASGQLGDNSTFGRNTPVSVFGLGSGVTSIAAGGIHTCALTSGGGVKCWGNNFHGALGNGTRTASSVPVNVTGLSSGVATIGAGDLQTCASTIAGSAKCWGKNQYGQLGNGSTVDSTVPVNVSGLGSGVTAIVSGEIASCALTTAGVKCWGNNTWGQLGNGTTISSPVPVNVVGLPSNISLLKLGATGSHPCVLFGNGRAKCWGWNEQGELGNNSNTNSSVPVDVLDLSSPPQNPLGDVTCNGVVDAVDALATLQYVVLLRTGVSTCPLGNPSGEINQLLADVDSNGEVTAVDAMFILQCNVGLSNVFCPDGQ